MSVRACALAAAILAGVGAVTQVPTPAVAQSLSAEVQALEAQLPGRLVNDPSRIDWESYGPEFYAESFVDPAVPGGGAARRFHVNKASEFIYSAGANIPLIRSVKRGDTITLGFWARTVSASTDDGKGVLRVRFQQDAPPYPGFGEETLSIGTEWQWYEVTTRAEQGLDRQDGIVAIQFGRTRQILEIGQAIIITGAASIVGTKAAAAAPAPVAAPKVELPKPLQQAGALFNDPTRRDWRIRATDGTSEQRDEPGIWLGKATRLGTGSATDASVRATLDLPTPVIKDRELLVAFAARTVSSTNPDGRAVVEVTLDSAATGKPLSGTRIALGPNWQLVRYIARPEADAQEGQLVVSMQVAGPGQSVDIGPVYMIRPQ